MENRRWTVWLKAIGGAIVAVLLVRMFLITSCVIPSSGMENSLYEGEGVLVNKWSYGLRMPFPSVFGYHRLAESPVKRGDIILFNNPNPTDKTIRIEQRKLFISRCIGVSGDTLMLNRELMDVKSEVLSPDSKALYVYPSAAEDTVLAVLDSLGITGNVLAGYTPEGKYIRSFSHYEYYLIRQKLEGKVKIARLDEKNEQEVHPFIVPRKNVPVKVYPWNVTLLCNIIINHEHRQAEVRRDTLWVEGKPVSAYTFSKNYYWVASNDPVNLQDSRLFGFVPEDHVIGKAWRIWLTSRKGRFFRRVQ
ncbi:MULTISPECIES: signal peptidase I [Bacteroidaceae]|uniref:signal peptidase I n=1 Tax=Bacteroidaceae TaxID=815 RepID=UPI0031FE9620